ncbi:hypothetical protein MIMGU_mgv1a018017mg, partial [Erythranthe guttata]
LKPATRLGLNTSAVICVRDKRHNKFHDSLLGIVESSLCDGPIYFSCFPNFTLSLTDPTLMHALCLDIKSEGFNMMQGAENIILLYRIQYKVMNTVIPRIKEIPTQHRAKSNLKVPKTITWDQVNLPEKWVLEKASEPVKQENRELEEIIEYPDGDVEIKFSTQRIAHLNLGRKSTSSVPISQFERDNLLGTKFTTDGVNQPEYKVELPPSTSGTSRNIPKRQSPTPSDMGYDDRSVYGINALTVEEKIELEFPIQGLAKELFYSPENEIKRKWFYSKNNFEGQKK